MRKSRLLLGVCVIAAILAAAWWYLTSAPEPELLGPLPPPRILLPILVDDTWGLIDETGEVVLEPRYHEILLFERQPDSDQGLPFYKGVILNGWWDPRVSTEDRNTTQVVLAMRIVSRRRYIPAWPFFVVDEELTITMLDAELKPRAYWSSPLPIDGLSYDKLWRNAFTRDYPVLPMDGQIAIVRADDIAMTQHIVTSDDSRFHGTHDGYMMKVHADGSQLYAPDGTLLYTGEGKQYIKDRIGTSFIIEYHKPLQREQHWLVDDKGTIVAGPEFVISRVSGQVVAALNFETPSYLMHVPSGRRVEIGKLDPTTGSYVDWYDIASTDRRIAVLRDSVLTLYDLELKVVTAVTLAESSTQVSVISATSQFIVGDTVIHEDGRQVAVGSPTWIEEEGLVFLRDGRTWLMGADMQAAPWGIDVREVTLPGTPARKVLTTHDGTRLCEPYAADMQALGYRPPDMTGYSEAVILLEPIGDDADQRTCLLQIGTEQYPTAFPRIASSTASGGTTTGEAVYHKGWRYDLDYHEGDHPYTDFDVDEETIRLAYEGGQMGLQIDRFDLKTRQWLTADADGSGAVAVGAGGLAEVSIPIHVGISPIYPTIHMVHFPDETWGYQRPDGTLLWRSRPPPVED